MTRKIYRTAQGRTVDLGALQLQNENIRAVGNMRVNARGDVLDSHNKPIDTRNQQVSRQYRKQTSNVVDRPVREPVATETAKPRQEFDEDFSISTETRAQASDASPVGGLAAAIAKARQVQQQPLTPKTTNTGISKI